jgi:hypothetical protein
MMAEIKECNERASQYESGNNPLTAISDSTPELVLHLAFTRLQYHCGRTALSSENLVQKVSKYAPAASFDKDLAAKLDCLRRMDSATVLASPTSL